MDQNEQEILDAQARLSLAKQKVAAAEDLKLTAAKIALQERQIAIEKEQRAQKEYYAAAEAKHLAKKLAEEQAQAAAANAERVAQQQLEQEFSRREEATRVRLAHEARLKKLNDDAFALEQDSKRIEAEAMSQRSSAEVPAFTPDTDKDAVNSGADQQAGGMEAAAPGQWGNPLLRNLLQHRSTETANAALPEVSVQTEEHHVLTNAEILENLKLIWGAEAVNASVEHMKTQRGVQNLNLQVYLSQHYTRLESQGA